MSLEERIETLQFCDRKYFFIQFENDIQIIFDEISKTKDGAHVGVNILKGNIYLKGDYFIPMKSADTFQLNCEELLKKLKTISCVLDVEVDTNHNLTFRLKRSMVYKTVLKEVMSLTEQYGMFKKSKSVLVLTNQEQSKSLDNMRNNLLAEHVISILANNGAKVFYNDLKPDVNFRFPNCFHLVCSDKCTLVDLCKDLEEKIHVCDYKTDSDSNKVHIDAKRFIEDNYLLSTYGNALSSIILFNDDVSQDLLKTCYIKHLIQDHVLHVPDVVIHITSQGQNKSTLKSGVLLSMLGGYSPMHVYIFNQSVQYKGKCSALGKDQPTVQLEGETSGLGNLEQHSRTPTQAVKDSLFSGSSPCEVFRTEVSQTQYRDSSFRNAADEFIMAHHFEIEKATALKYEAYDAGSEVWSSRIRALADAAVKFDILKQNHSNILNLRPPSGRDGEKNFGVFVQYNYARLSNLFRNFQSKVKEGTYFPLCPLEDADFGLLVLEEEWNLFYYVLSFPKLVDGVLNALLEENIGKGRIRLNKVCLMLQELCQCLSLYYGRIRILGGPQAHLQRGMNARLWMLKGIRQVFENAFRMLNIQGLDLM